MKPHTCLVSVSFLHTTLFIRSKLVNASVIWNSCTKKDIHQLKVNQRKVARLIFGKYKRLSHLMRKNRPNRSDKHPHTTNSRGQKRFECKQHSFQRSLCYFMKESSRNICSDWRRDVNFTAELEQHWKQFFRILTAECCRVAYTVRYIIIAFSKREHLARKKKK